MKEPNQSGKFLLSRRTLLKAVAAGLFAAAVPPLPGAGTARAQANTGGKKVLTVYYSRSGNTRAMAQLVHSLAGGDIVELETVHPYPEGYRSTTDQAKRELEANFYPQLKVTVEDISSYDLIFVGSPSWWGTFASPVRGFLAQHDFSGKKLAPFITHEGSRLGKSLADMQSLCPGAAILEGLAVRGSDAANARAEVAQWRQRIEAVK